MKAKPRLISKWVTLCLLPLIIDLTFTSVPGKSILAPPNPTSPSARFNPAMTYDSVRGKIVLFGGMEFGGRHLGDTWEWDGARWIKVSETGPPPRSGHAMTFDKRAGKVVLFGGGSGSGHGGGGPAQMRDTWEWDGKVWTLATAPGPAGRSGPQLVYDSRRRKVILFGGIDVALKRNFADTWEWDGRLWTQVSSSGPAARFYHVMAYDEARGKVVLFGGNVAEGQLSLEKFAAGRRGDTWEWDGKKWIQVNASGPSPRDHHSMTYDAARKKAILFGGFDGNYLADTWEWDGKTWTQLAASGPPARGGKPGLAFDRVRRKLVLFGGGIGGGTAAKPEAFNDTWEWNGKEWTNVGGR
jgi:galactose oxidase-like protein